MSELVQEVNVTVTKCQCCERVFVQKFNSKYPELCESCNEEAKLADEESDKA